MSTKPPGRPPASKDGTAESNIVLRVTRRRKAAYVSAANARNTTLSNFIQTTCDAAAGFTDSPKAQ